MNNMQKIFFILFLLFLICIFTKLQEPFAPDIDAFFRKLKNHKDKWPRAQTAGIGEIRYQSPFYKQLAKH